MDGGAAAEAGAAALDAAGALAEGEVLPVLGEETVLDELGVGVVDGGGPEVEDLADEALGEDAVEGGRRRCWRGRW